MAAVGQAQANAKLVAEYFLNQQMETEATVLFMGAGGQMFEFVPPSFLLPYQTTFADIHSGYLKWLISPSSPPRGCVTTPSRMTLSAPLSREHLVLFWPCCS